MDAKAPGLRAEEAFYQLIAWHGADYTIGDEQHDSLEETVTQDTRLLIAECMRRLVKQEDAAEKVEKTVRVMDKEMVKDELERTLAAEIEESAPLAPVTLGRGSDKNPGRTNQDLPEENRNDPLFEVLPEHGEMKGERDRDPYSSESPEGIREQKRINDEEAPATSVAGSVKKAAQSGRLDDDDERAFLKTLVARGLLKHRDAS